MRRKEEQERIRYASTLHVYHNPLESTQVVCDGVSQEHSDTPQGSLYNGTCTHIVMYI